MLQPAQQRRLKGQLRLCSRAIFFEPDYVQAPILMFPFSKIRAIERLPESLASPSASNSKWRNNSLEGFQLKTSLLVKMKENGVDAPYVFEKEDSIWWFSLEFSRVQSVCLFFLRRQKDSLLPHTFVSPVDFFFWAGFCGPWIVLFPMPLFEHLWCLWMW